MIGEDGVAPEVLKELRAAVNRCRRLGADPITVITTLSTVLGETIATGGIQAGANLAGVLAVCASTATGAHAAEQDRIARASYARATDSGQVYRGGSARRRRRA